MKKLIISAITVLIALSATAQQEGLYLTVGGSVGANNFRYTLDNDNKSTPQLGFGGSVGLQYFFTKHWGVATGVGISFYNSKARYANDSRNDPAHYLFNGMHDDDPGDLGDDYKNYSLMLELNNWTETQKAYFLEIPLMFMYQTKWGASEKVGMYFGIGPKLQLPIISQQYEVKNKSHLSVSAYYSLPDMTLPDPDGPDVSNHGYGTNSKTGLKGDIDLKIGFAAAAEAGFLFTLSPRVDLTLGAYFDYGFTNIKDGNKTTNGYLIRPENGATTIQPSAYTGDNLQYNGYINSHAVDKVNLLGMGGKIGLRIKLGRLSEANKPMEEGATPAAQRSKIDTLYIINSTQCCKPDTVVCATPETNTAVASTQPVAEDVKTIAEPIFFDLDEHTLLPASVNALDNKVEIMKKYPTMKVLITGNTCDWGTEQHNIELGEQRAVAAQQYLESKGIEKERISTVTQSFSHPVKPNDSEEDRQWNRRCDFIATGY